MDLLLTILGYAFIALTVLALVAFIVIRLGWKYIKNMSEAMSNVELVEDPDPKWLSKPEASKLIEEFEAKGFKLIKVYKPIMMKIKTAFLANSARDQFAGIYSTPAGIKAEFSADTIEGLSLNVTNDEMADVYAIKPNKIINSCPNGRPAEMYTQFKELVSDAQLRVVPDEELTSFLETSINKDLQNSYDTHERPLWEDGVEDFTQRWSKHYNGKKLRSSYSVLVAEHLEHIASEAIEQLGESEDISAATWNRYEDNNLIFNPRFEKEGFAEYLELNFACLDSVSGNRIKSMSKDSKNSEELLDLFTAEYPHLGLTRFAKIQNPVEAEVIGFTDPENN